MSADEQQLATQTENEMTDMHRVTLVVGGAASSVEKAAREQRASWLQSSQEMARLFHDADATVLEADATMVQLRGSIQDLNANADDAIRSIVQTMGVAQSDLKLVNDILADPVIQDSLRHVDASTASVDASLADIRRKVASLTAPPTTRDRVANYLETALKIWFYVK